MNIVCDVSCRYERQLKTASCHWPGDVTTVLYGGRGGVGLGGVGKVVCDGDVTQLPIGQRLWACIELCVSAAAVDLPSVDDTVRQ